MTTKAVVVAGASGEIGKGIVHFLAEDPNSTILAVDLNASEEASTKNIRYFKGDILDPELYGRLTKDFAIETIYHLAALLSTGSEKDPERAHRVNVEGSFNLLTLARTQAEKHRYPVTFVFPSTIAIYGTPSSAGAEIEATSVTEDQFLAPITIYGCNKLYIENLGRYFGNHYRMFEGDRTRINFRCVRLPGVLCSDTLPTGGTSDYGPEMIHAAAQGKTYDCFVTPDTKLPFIAKPDAVKALVSIGKAPIHSLKQAVYNITSFSPTAAEIHQETLKYFPHAEINYKVHPQRLAIVKSWPRILDDSAARRDWGWAPQYDFESTFRDYLVPGIRKRYGR